MISIVSRFRGARIVTTGNVSVISEPVSGVKLGVEYGKTVYDAHTKSMARVDKIIGPETRIAKRLAERYL